MASYGAREAFLAGIIDYAGTFPPAALPLRDALRLSVEFRIRGTHPWLYSKLALPLSTIVGIGPSDLLAAGTKGSAWFFTALADSRTTDDFLSGTHKDASLVGAYNRERSDAPCRQQIIGYETKLPREFSQLHETLDVLGSTWNSSVHPYFELVPGSEWLDETLSTSQALGDWKKQHTGLEPGIKVRTGGNAVPSAEQLAKVLESVVVNNLRFKATQGLHEAVSHGGEFGFFNLFGALYLMRGLGLDKFDVGKATECLKDTEAFHFVLDQHKFAWKEYQIELEKIESLRPILGATFGSCSLDEPDEALRRFFKEA